MKNKIKLLGFLVLVIVFSLSIKLQAGEGNGSRCDTCIPQDDITCSVGTGDPNNPTEFCEDSENMSELKPIDPFE